MNKNIFTSEVKNADVIRRIVVAVFLVLEIATIFLVIFSFIMGGESRIDAFAQKRIESFNENWTDENGKEWRLDDVNSDIVLYKDIPSMDRDETFYLSQTTGILKASVDGELLYDNTPNNPALLGKTTGYSHVFFIISKEMAGRKLRLEIINPYKDGATKLANVYLGYHDDVVLKRLADLFPSFLLSAMVLVLGIVSLAIYFSVSKKIANPNTWKYMAMLAVNMGVFMVADSKLLPLMIGYEAQFHFITELCLYFFTLPATCFFASQFNRENKILPLLISGVAVGFYVITLYQRFGLGKDFHEILWQNHIILGSCLVYVGVTIIRQLIRNPGKNVFNTIGVVCLCVLSVVDMINYYTNPLYQASAGTKMGVICFLIFEGIQMFVNFMQDYAKTFKAKLLNRLAYHDGLTDLYNRTSFDEDMSFYSEGGTEQILIAVMDLNSLKYVNDAYGHLEGDKQILAAAEAIKAGFKQCGKCYRIGGDEFSVVISSKNAKTQFEAAIQNMNRKIEEINKRQELKKELSIAVGYAIKGEEESASRVFEAADAAMYKNKKAMKAAAAFESRE